VPVRGKGGGEKLKLGKLTRLCLASRGKKLKGKAADASGGQ